MIYKYNGKTIGITDGNGQIVGYKWKDLNGNQYFENWHKLFNTTEKRSLKGIEELNVQHQETSTQYKKVFTLDEWMTRFNEDELIRYYTLIADGDIQVIGLNQTLLTHSAVDLDSQGTIQGLALLEVKGVITAERKAEMLEPETINLV